VNEQSDCVMWSCVIWSYVIWSCFQVITQRQEAEQELTNQLEKLRVERQSLVKQLSTAQRQLSCLHVEKHDVEKCAARLEQDRTAVIRTMDKVPVEFDVIIHTDSIECSTE